MFDRLKADERGQSRGMIRNVMLAIITLGLFGWIANIFLNIIPAENDTLGVVSVISDWGPKLMLMCVAAIVALVAAYVFSIFNRV